MTLIDNAKRAWKLFSMQAMGVALGLQVTWTSLPDEMRASIPPTVVQWATGILLVLGMVGRIVKQGASDDKQP